MKLKEQIREAAESHAPYPDRSEFMVDRSLVFIRQESFKAGADFTIKAVIEMLEERENTHFRNTEIKRGNECRNIINLLKSEA